MFGIETTPFLLLLTLIGGCLWGKYRINSESSSFYRTRRLTRKQEKVLIDGLKAARTYIRTN